jgi:hypothetical protein
MRGIHLLLVPETCPQSFFSRSLSLCFSLALIYVSPNRLSTPPSNSSLPRTFVFSSLSSPRIFRAHPPLPLPLGREESPHRPIHHHSPRQSDIFLGRSDGAFNSDFLSDAVERHVPQTATTLLLPYSLCSPSCDAIHAYFVKPDLHNY